MDGIKQNCVYAMVKTDSQPQIFEIDKSLYYILNLQNYNLTCSLKGNRKILNKTVNCTKNVVLNMDVEPIAQWGEIWGDENPICLAQTQNWEITVGKTIQRHGTNESHQYVINLAFVTKAFDREHLNEISGDSLFDEMPEISFKKLDWEEGGKSVSDLIATDQELKINFDKVMNATKADRKIFYSDTGLLFHKLSSYDSLSVMDIFSIAQGILIILIIVGMISIGRKLCKITATLVALQLTLTRLTAEAKNPFKLNHEESGISESDKSMGGEHTKLFSSTRESLGPTWY